MSCDDVLITYIGTHGEFFSVRARIRQGDDSYPVTAQSWPLLLYAGNCCFADDVEKGLFKSSLLVKVCVLSLLCCLH